MTKYKSTVIIKTKLVTIRAYKTIAIVEIGEGVAVSFKEGQEVFARLLSILGSEPWVYISNRVNSYSIDPNDYTHLNQIPTLKGIGVIQYKKSIKTAIDLERVFVKKPFKTFNNLDAAIEWALEKVEE